MKPLFISSLVLASGRVYKVIGVDAGAVRAEGRKVREWVVREGFRQATETRRVSYENQVVGYCKYRSAKVLGREIR